MMNGLSSFFEFLGTRKEELTSLVIEHIGLTLLAVLLAIIIGVPLGILITRYKKLAGPIIGVANVIQAIPSLALLGFLIPVIGIGSKPAIMMVFLYSLLPIIKNTYTGLMNINPDIIEASKGMGLTSTQTLRIVQIPLALPIIMTGIRISAVTAVGLMTIAAFVGAGGLGYMVFSGVQTVNNNMILAGAIPACILALLMDFVVGKIEKSVTPSGIKSEDGTIKIRKRKKMSKFSKIALPSILVVVLVIAGFSFFKKEESIVIASKNYNEQLILGNLVAELIEQTTDINVERKLNLGGSSIAFNALKSGEVDMYVEYTGTGLVNIMKQPAIGDPDKAYEEVSEYFDKEYGITWLKPLGFNNTYTMAVKKETAQKYNLKTYSDLAKVSNELRLAGTIEFTNREDGYLGLKNEYNMLFKQVDAIDGGLRYTSLENGKSDVIDAFSTDGLLKAFDLTVLEDDKQFFPPYHAVPIIKNETLEKYPELKDIVNQLGNQIDEETMRELNYKVDKLEQDPAIVAKEFLLEIGLID